MLEALLDATKAKQAWVLREKLELELKRDFDESITLLRLVVLINEDVRVMLQDRFNCLCERPSASQTFHANESRTDLVLVRSICHPIHLQGLSSRWVCRGEPE